MAPDGELLVSGAGYVRRLSFPVAATGRVTNDGWFATGDLVDISENGTITMHGRKKSVINVGGMKVFPEEIEAVLIPIRPS